MFTIKHIDKKNTEELIEAVNVWYEDNSEDAVNTSAPIIRKLYYTTGHPDSRDYQIRIIDFGTIYVMNSNGKTIANYELFDQE
jgi:hypothetical protein